MTFCYKIGFVSRSRYITSDDHGNLFDRNVSIVDGFALDPGLNVTTRPCNGWMGRQFLVNKFVPLPKFRKPTS
jgi:hypothetical protein